MSVGRFFWLGFLFLLVGCSQGKKLAPVEEAFGKQSSSAETYRVRSGDTLYSVAFAFNRDYKGLAALNSLRAPYPLQVNQVLRIKGSARKISPTLLKNHSLTHFSNWVWPSQGYVIKGFSPGLYQNPGLELSSKVGSPVYSVANGVVVYSGAGVRGYGNLILIKHENDYLSAYAFNQRNLAKEGMRVQAGQKIAEMGTNNAGEPLLHFELRYHGKPVNPLSFLDARL